MIAAAAASGGITLSTHALYWLVGVGIVIAGSIWRAGARMGGISEILRDHERRLNRLDGGPVVLERLNHPEDQIRRQSHGST